MLKNWVLYKKLHKWPGLIISCVLLYFAITGIIMNHRILFSGMDMNRNLLPEVYHYKNWNNAALKGNLILNSDSFLVYGNIGIWLTDSSFGQFEPWNSGFPQGIDNRKVSDVLRTENGDIYAASLFGLYIWNRETKVWSLLDTGTKHERFTGLACHGDTLYALSRSHLYKGRSRGIHTVFIKIELPAPDGYIGKVTLFQTVWQIHSGEILGLPGKLYVDLLGIITAFLSLTGIIYFFFPGWIKRRFQRNKSATKLASINKWSLRWHNKLGAWTFVLLIILFITGMFLRPPLLLFIAKADIAPVRFSHLDQPNPWYDQLRDILYDPREEMFLLSTSRGMFSMEVKDLKPKRFQVQPPVSVMGINTLEPYRDNAYLVGSFSGLFLWNPEQPEIFNFTDGKIYQEQYTGRPVGDFKVTGTLSDGKGHFYLADYDKGMVPLSKGNAFPQMPENILETSGISLWNVCLEIHTGRIFQAMLGDFYILIVPFVGLTGITVVLSGYLLWRRKYKIRPDLV
jgi:hypothetical protein